jgi:hypothetical protein
MRNSVFCLHAILFCAPLFACGAVERPRGPTEADLRSISEAEAIDILTELLAETSVAAAVNWQVNVGAPEPFEVDLRLGQTSYGIEYVSPQDRRDHGERIPRPDPSGQLRIMPGAGDDAQAQILVLEHSTYRYDPDRERVQRGSIGPAEAEERLRRDLRDYLEYVRGQGAL